MTTGIFNPRDDDRASVTRPARTAVTAGVRKWYANGIFPYPQDFNDLIAQLRTAGDAFSIPDQEGDDEYLLSILKAAGRELLSTSRTYYVRTDGNDANDGLSNTAGGAFATIGAAVAAVSRLNFNGQTVTVKVGDGTFAESVVVSGPLVGGGTLKIEGNTTTPANCLLSPASGSAFSAQFNVSVQIAGFKFTSPDAYGIISNIGSVVTIYGAVEFGSCGVSHMLATTSSRIVRSSAYTVSGAAPRHIQAIVNSSFQGVSGVVTCSGTPNFSTAFVEMNRSSNYYEGVSPAYSGAATGFKYFVDSDCSLRGLATVLNFDQLLPGDKAGQVRPVETSLPQPFSNLLINGDGVLANGASGAIGDDAYGAHDRWYALSQSGTITPSTVSNVADDIPSLIRLTNSHGASQKVGYAQILSAESVRRLRGKRMSMALTARASEALGLRVSVLSWSGTADAVTSDVVNNWSSGTYTTGNFFISTGLVSVLAAVSQSINTTLVYATGSTWYIDVPSNCNNLIFVIHSSSLLSSSGTLDFRAALSVGLQAVPFDFRPAQIERKLAERRLQRLTVNSINGTIFVPLSEMAGVPALSIVSGAGSVANATKNGFHLTHSTVASHDILAIAEL